ncbi:MAG: hypothetical protein ABH986_03660 [archaeon]
MQCNTCGKAVKTAHICEIVNNQRILRCDECYSIWSDAWEKKRPKEGLGIGGILCPKCKNHTRVFSATTGLCPKCQEETK